MKKSTLLIIFLILCAGQTTKAQVLELWGTTYWGGLNGGGVIMHINEIDSPKFAFPYSFDEPTGDVPRGSLIYDKDSLFYGMTLEGGADSNGVLFSYDPETGIYTDLHDFDSATGTNPYGSLIQDTSGKLYGMTSMGGLDNFGKIFSYNPADDSFDNILHLFDSINGKGPVGKLLQGKNDTLYGMTQYGGASNAGVIFEFETSHEYDTLHNFNDSTGAEPTGSLIRVGNTLYGMTPQGGAYDDGVIFSFNLSAKKYTDLLDFNYTNGSNPYGSLFLASDSLLYGMTENGVDSNSYGEMFSFKPDSINTFKIIHYFDGLDGSNPAGGFMQGTTGKLYATTQWGGLNFNGVIFSYDPDSGIYTDLYDLNNAVGGNPYCDLVETDVITGIKPVANLASNVSIYPNPSSGLIYIKCTTTIDAIKVTDLLGRVIYSSLPKQNKLPLTIKETGMYFITLTSDNQTATTKIIINR